MPISLMVYNAGEWLAPGGEDDTDAQRAAWQAWEAARRSWYDAHGYPSVEAAIAVPDEPFDGGQLVFAGRPVTAAELQQIQTEIASGARPRP